jgi:hypothetical protein
MHSLRLMFLSSIVNPPDSLPMPPYPEIKPFEVIEHRDVVNPVIPGAIFGVRELDSVPDIAADEDAVVMVSVQRY